VQENSAEEKIFLNEKYEYQGDFLLSIESAYPLGGGFQKILYFYDKDLRVKEKKFASDNSLTFTTDYIYENGKLSKVNGYQDSINFTEEYIYQRNALIEMKRNYYGIDPGFSPCLGNFTFYYEY
jgi:hypothetical protein